MVGHDKILQSLRTTDIKEARRRYWAVVEETEAEWDLLRTLIEATDRKRELPLISLSHKDAHAIAGEIYRAQVAAHEDDPGDPVEWHRLIHLATNALPLDRRPEGAPKRIWTQGMMTELVAKREFGRLVSGHLDKRELRLDTKSFTMVYFATAQAPRDAAVQLKRNALGDYNADPAASRFPPSYSPPLQQDAVDVEEFIKDWIEKVPLSRATRQSWTGKLRNLMRHAQKTDVAAITDKDVVAWRDFRLASGISERTISEGDLAGVYSMLKWRSRRRSFP